MPSALPFMLLLPAPFPKRLGMIRQYIYMKLLTKLSRAMTGGLSNAHKELFSIRYHTKLRHVRQNKEHLC